MFKGEVDELSQVFDTVVSASVSFVSTDPSHQFLPRLFQPVGIISYHAAEQLPDMIWIMIRRYFLNELVIYYRTLVN